MNQSTGGKHEANGDNLSNELETDVLLPVNPLRAIKLYLMVETPDSHIMDQIEFDINSDKVESLRRARHLMVSMSIWEGEDTQPSRTVGLLFPQDSAQNERQCMNASQASGTS